MSCARRNIEEPTVSRPFYAFGILMVLLALAMLAVSSNNRPTIQAHSGAGKGSISAPRQQRGGVFVIVLPAGNGEIGGDRAQATHRPSVGARYASSRGVAPRHRTVARRMSTARIVLATSCLGVKSNEKERCSLDDAATDYQENIGTPRESGLEADEELALFHSFVSVAPNRANLRAEPIMSWLATQWASMWAIIEGTRNWLMGEIATLSSLPAGIWQPTGPQSSRPKIDWNDYAELMDEALSD
jgi:hypothetical protein